MQIGIIRGEANTDILAATDLDLLKYIQGVFLTGPTLTLLSVGR